MLISSKASKQLSDLLLNKRVKDIYCSGLYLSAKWFVFSQTVSEGNQMIILPDKDTAEYCAADLYHLIEGDNVFFLPESGKGVERSNYKSSLGVQRTSSIGRLIDNRESDSLSVYVTYPDALKELVPEANSIKSSVLHISKGDELKYDSLIDNLFSFGFVKEDFVSRPGQFAVRGYIIDVFSYSNNEPFRISFWGDEVDSIHIFDTNTQISKSEIEKIDIYSDVVVSSNYEEVSYTSITRLISENTVIWLDSPDLYGDCEFMSDLTSNRKVYLKIPLALNDKVEDIKFNISPQPVFNKNFEILCADIENHLRSGYTVRIYGEKNSQLERLKSIIIQNKGKLPSFVKGKNVHNGFIDNDDLICIYSDHEIFDRFHRVTMRRTVEKSEQLTINDLSSFNIGDYIVHIDHGVGVFGGLVRMRDDKGRMHEVVKLIYKDNDIVFVSVHSLNKISRFRSKEGLPPKINKLGSKAWTNIKTSAKAKIKDIAKDLIQLYAKRKASKGFAYSPDSYLQTELESSFMYEDTPDQESATIAIKKDMQDESPMDRLVCGDVGFGKTEIAIRAAFKAVCDSKQVAVLVPTTILSLQHFETFKSRLADLPCNIEYVSRLRTAKEVSDIQKRLKEGKIDILIGTHKILGKGFEFHDLGLLIIDEEQKFGVGAKEKLRQLKASIDTLTLTATPIPRTLQFSLLGARDLSIINTPPPNRIPVQTEILLFDEKEIKSIINYELNRGGQVFFLHNRVEELNSVYEILHRLVPDMKICVAHGQMESSELENKILEFIRGDYDLLLCTTIIENGLDIPNANTIIINHAHMIGLSDLHQLRGRVGRSNKKAFCYLIVPPLTSLTEDARRRLKAIEEFSDLGSGFNIAMQDLDIRGAGNLLGAEQSGFITDMGYETYQKILAEAMEEIGVETGITTRRSEDSFIVDCNIETDQLALIPDDYIDITAEKIRIYKQLDSLENEKEIGRLRSNLEDRFGRIPDELDNLFYVVRIRNIGQRLGFEKIIIKNGIMILHFISNPLSPYMKTDIFDKILTKVQVAGNVFEFKQNQTKYKLVARNIDSLAKAYTIINLLR